MTHVVVNIPTWCEASNIQRLTAEVDERIQEAFQGAQTLLVNTDNSSPDGTSELFQQVPTATRKVALRTAPGLRGKGYNLRLAFELALQEGADALVSLDGDLEIVPRDWLPAFVAHVLSGADLVIPNYPRHWYDGNVTNQIVAPLVAAVTGQPIRQPTAGEFAYSPRMMRHLLDLKPDDDVLFGGMDVLGVVHALRYHHASQIALSTGKIHSWRSDSAGEIEIEMRRKFRAMVGPLLGELASWPAPRGFHASFPRPPPLEDAPKLYVVGPVASFARQACSAQQAVPCFRELLGPASEGELPELGDAAWAGVLSRAYAWAQRSALDDVFFEALKALLFARLAHVLPELKQDGVDPMVDRVTNQLSVLLCPPVLEI